MPIQFFNDSQRKRLDSFPPEIQYKDLVTFFTLTEKDLAQIPVYSAAFNRLGFALQLCTLRFMGFIPDDLKSTPQAVVEYLARQLDVAPESLASYGTRPQTKSDHTNAVLQYLGFHRATEADLAPFCSWLIERALEHDKPSLLYELMCEKMHREQILRPGITSLERIVASARQGAQTQTMHALTNVLTSELRLTLDGLLIADSHTGRTSLSWLRRRAISNSPQSIQTNLEKIAFLKESGVFSWDLPQMINPNRIKQLTTIARKSTARGIRRITEDRKYPILVAFLYQSVIDITDETIDMFDRCLADTDARAKRDLDEYRKAIARATNEKVKLFSEMGRIVLDPEIPDPQLRAAIFRRIPKAVLQNAVNESERIVRPLDDNHFDFLDRRYSYLRQFTPAFLKMFDFRSNVELTNLLVEVDRWTQFSKHFYHPSGSESRNPEFLRYLYASLLAQGCNLSLTKMAQIAQLSHDRLIWYNNWYIRQETLSPATSELVNFHSHQPLTQHWGSGTLSSSDGQRFPVSGKVRIAEALPRYFGYGKGVVFYTWTSDQYSQYGTKVIPATIRDATYVLDEILDNETELPILEHTTDTAGYTEIVFALFDLLGMQFSPRIRDLSDQHLYRLDPTKIYPHLESQLKGKINIKLILRHWDDLLRIAGSLKMGWVTASLFISKLKSYPRQNVLTRALQEYGRLAKTIFILRYLHSEPFRRRINRQLNKGEALHSLRHFLFFANGGKIRRKQEEEMSLAAGCLNLLTNAVIVWNTVYMNAAIEQLKEQEHPVAVQDIKYCIAAEVRGQLDRQRPSLICPMKRFGHRGVEVLDKISEFLKQFRLGADA